MQQFLRLFAFVLILCVLTTLSPVLAQDSTQRNRQDRLFLGFAEESATADRQWWEGRLEISDGAMGGTVDSVILHGVAAFQPWDDVEVGASVGFGNTDTSGIDPVTMTNLPDGSGATDLDVWGKWFLGKDANDTRFAVGGMVTIPTGDDTAGLGTDAFSVGGFASMRYHLPKWTLSGHVGLRANGDAQFLGMSEVNGETSGLVGLGGVIPLSDRLTLIAETEYESERFEGPFGESDFRVLGGLNVHGIGRGMIRAAVTVGLDDGAPDAQIIVGYASEF